MKAMALSLGSSGIWYCSTLAVVMTAVLVNVFEAGQVSAGSTCAVMVMRPHSCQARSGSSQVKVVPGRWVTGRPLELL